MHIRKIYLQNVSLSDRRIYQLLVLRVLFIHEGFLKNQKESDVNLKLDGVFKDETSFETSLKQVLKQNDYEKLEPVIVKLAHSEEITIQDIMNLTNKSRTTAWRYMQILAECGVVEVMGNTNNVRYKKVNKKDYK